MKAAISFAEELSGSPLSLEQLCARAAGYEVERLESRLVFDEQHYVRRILHWEADLEVVLLCWSPGQSSGIHDHRGSNCVTRVLSGRFRESFFRADSGTGLYLDAGGRILSAGDISGLQGDVIHQVTNAQVSGRGALLNFYSPAFSPAPRTGTGRYLTLSAI